MNPKTAASALIAALALATTAALAALKDSDASDTVKVLNLRKLLAEKVEEEGSARQKSRHSAAAEKSSYLVVSCIFQMVNREGTILHTCLYAA